MPRQQSDMIDTGYGLFAGARLSPNLAVEGGFADLAKATAIDGTTSGSLKLSALYLDAVGILPLSPQRDLFGRVGALPRQVQPRRRRSNTALPCGIRAIPKDEPLRATI